MKRVIIVEDETAAQLNLRSMLTSLLPDVEVVEVLESVEESVEYFSGVVDADVVFMDIHLADGDSFRIFQSVDINIPIIFTTAYDEYALEAFKVNSVDYLLKPFKEEDLRRALDKLHRYDILRVLLYISVDIGRGNHTKYSVLLVKAVLVLDISADGGTALESQLLTRILHAGYLRHGLRRNYIVLLHTLVILTRNVDIVLGHVSLL